MVETLEEAAKLIEEDTYIYINGVQDYIDHNFVEYDKATGAPVTPAQ